MESINQVAPTRLTCYPGPMRTKRSSAVSLPIGKIAPVSTVEWEEE